MEFHCFILLFHGFFVRFHGFLQLFGAQDPGILDSGLQQALELVRNRHLGREVAGVGPSDQVQQGTR